MDTIDPEIQFFLDEMAAAWQAHPPLSTLPLPEQRRIAERVRARWTEGGPVMRLTRDSVRDTTAGPMRARLHVPMAASAPCAAMVYLHGGGFTLFSIDSHDRLMREYAEAAGIAVIGLDYALAPEAKYPAALDQVVDFLVRLADAPRDWGVDPARIAIGGDSAGGNLSYAACLRLRDSGRPELVRAILANYAGVDAAISDEAEARFGGPDAILNRDEARGYWDNYLRTPDDAADPCACPLRAQLQGLPPVFNVVAGSDLLSEQELEMDRRLRAAGVRAQLAVYPGASHSFLEAMSVSALARAAIADGARFLRAELG